jgi:hypothetical protein
VCARRVRRSRDDRTRSKTACPLVTRSNFDGGNIRDSIEGTRPGMNFSHEVAQEFQF